MKKRRVNERFDEQIASGAKKFVKYDEGAKLYSMGEVAFRQLAKDAKATYHIKRTVLVNVEIINEYLENFKDDFSDEY